MPKPLVCASDLLDIDLSGSVYVVTGGHSGIGLSTVEQLLTQGAEVIVGARRTDDAEAALAPLRGKPGRASVIALDLADLASVRRFAEEVTARHPRLTGLVNNAGVMNTPRGKTKDGFETQFGVNHLGHFLLTELLLPTLVASAPSRIVNLSSAYHDHAMGRLGRIDFSDLHFETRKYDGWEAYAQSKLANLLHARELGARLAGTGVTAVSVHPGWVRTRLIRHSLPTWAQDYVLRPVLRFAGMIEPFEGAQTTLHALLSPDVPRYPGAFFSQMGAYRDRASNAGGWPLRSPNKEANDDSIARRLAEVSRELVGLEKLFVPETRAAS